MYPAILSSEEIKWTLYEGLSIVHGLHQIHNSKRPKQNKGTLKRINKIRAIENFGYSAHGEREMILSHTKTLHADLKIST